MHLNLFCSKDTYSKSDDPCSELYHGSGAESELEVQTITSYIKSLGRVIGAIDFHSYHQKVLYPPGRFTYNTSYKLIHNTACIVAVEV